MQPFKLIKPVETGEDKIYVLVDFERCKVHACHDLEAYRGRVEEDALPDDVVDLGQCAAVEEPGARMPSVNALEKLIQAQRGEDYKNTPCYFSTSREVFFKFAVNALYLDRNGAEPFSDAADTSRPLMRKSDFWQQLDNINRIAPSSLQLLALRPVSAPVLMPAALWTIAETEFAAAKTTVIYDFVDERLYFTGRPANTFSSGPPRPGEIQLNAMHCLILEIAGEEIDAAKLRRALKLGADPLRDGSMTRQQVNGTTNVIKVLYRPIDFEITPEQLAAGSWPLSHGRLRRRHGFKDRARQIDHIA